MSLDLSLRILVVDDMPAMRSIVRGMLEGLGFSRIEEAEDGETAWQLLRQTAESGASPEENFGLVIADWNMPGMSGVDLLRATRMFPPTRDLPFLIITGEGDRAHFGEAVRAGVTDYVVKPFTAPQLVEKIRQAFSS